MLYCPTCGNGYEDREDCPNCEEKLVPRFDEQQLQSPLVLIDNDAPPEYSHMMKEILEQNGIFCMIKSQYLIGKGEASDGVALLVPEVKAEEARELIAAFFKEQETEAAQKVCPECGQAMPDYKILCPNCGKILEDG